MTLLRARLALIAVVSALVPLGQSQAAAMHHGSMSMDHMMAEVETKTGDAFDKAFIDMMIPHHEGAMAMARIARHEAMHPELREMAGDMIVEQRSEIRTLKRWYRAWGYQKTPVTRMHWRDMSMTMSDSDEPMTMDHMVRMLRNAEGNEFDLMFIDMMIPHHQGAIDMAELALTQAKHGELKQMARQIIESQQAEIGHMQELRAELAGAQGGGTGSAWTSWNDAKALIAACRVHMTVETHDGVLTLHLHDGGTRRVRQYEQDELYAAIQDANSRCDEQIVIGME
jgi:uncharacterized protein (DUF305 family)